MTGKRQCIFFVDDEESVRKVVYRTLCELNVRVELLDSGRRCLESLRNRACDLLITDVKMPAMDGIELLRRAKTIAPWLPVLIVTGFGDIPLAVRAVKMGASDFVEKPLERDRFLAVVQGLLRRSSETDRMLGKTLTRSERNILGHILVGRSSKEIAGLLHRSIRTVELHRQHIMRKMGVSNVVELIHRTHDMGLDQTVLPGNGGPFGWKE